MTADEILVKVNEFLDNLRYDRKPNGLYDPIKYVLSMGGKRIRPTLMLLAYNLYKDDPESILMPACALETYHNYTLLHDDLMDNADVRRGKTTVHRKWNANTAILSGDSMLVLAYERMSNCGAKYLKDVLDVFTETALEIGEGQQYDMEFETRNDVNEDEYVEMIRLKTSVLLACALKIGAVLADASEEDAENLYKFGEQIGLAFQLQDDYLDAFGDPETFGKQVGGDIIENKKTFLYLKAVAFSKEEEAQELRRLFAIHPADNFAKIKTVKELFIASGAAKATQDAIQDFTFKAFHTLEKMNIDSDKKALLKIFGENLMGRNV